MRRYISILLAIVLAFATVQTDVVFADETGAEIVKAQNDSIEPVPEATVDNADASAAVVEDSPAGDTDAVADSSAGDADAVEDNTAGDAVAAGTEDAVDTVDGIDANAATDASDESVPSDTTEAPDAADTTEMSDTTDNVDNAEPAETADTPDTIDSAASAEATDTKDIVDHSDTGTVSEETDNTATGNDTTAEAEDTTSEVKEAQEMENTEVEDQKGLASKSIYDFSYASYKDGVKITGFTGEATGHINIPDIIVGKKVLMICSNAFQDKAGFTGKLVIPDYVEVIGNNAFRGCSGFTGLELPDSLEEIGSNAFCDCTGMTGRLTIPGSLTSLGYNAFDNCRGFTSLKISNGVTSLGSAAFEDCSGIKNALVIPDSITSISADAFNGCSSIPSVKIGSGVTAIEAGAFYGCSRIKTLTIPDSVTAIGDKAFYDCKSLTSLVLPANLQTLGLEAFQNCSGVKGNLKIPATITNFGPFAFCNFGRPNECTLTLSEGLAAIAQGAFCGSGFKGKLIIPGTLTVIPADAFKRSTCFTSLEIRSGVEDIRLYAFKECSGLSNTLSIPDTVTVIGQKAFFKCEGLKGLKLSDNLNTLGSEAFGYCSGIKGVLTIPSSVTQISSDALDGMYNISQINNNTSINIKASNFIASDDTSCFVKNGTGEIIRRAGAIGKGTYIRNTKPAISKVAAVSKGLKVSWTTATGAEKYQLQRSSGNGWKDLGEMSGTSYTDDTAKTGKSYKYRIRSVSGDSKSSWSAASPAFYYPSSTKISKLTGESKAMIVNWKKNNSVSGYQIQYSLKKDFKNSKKIDVNSKSTTSRKIKNLKKGKTYYVRIRTFKKAGSNKCYSVWSGVKKIKIK